MTRQNKKQPKRNSLRRRVMLAVVPQKENDYQPHLIRRYGLLAVLLLVIGVQFFYNFNQTGSVLGEKANVSLEALLNETNNERQKHNVPELRLSQKLDKAANLKAKDMFDKQYWGHDAPDGTRPWHWLAEADYSYIKAGENLARNFYTAEAVTAAWMDSTDHRKNILEPDYTEVGFAVHSGELEGEPATIIVALYGRPAGAGAVSSGTLVAGANGGSLGILARIGIGMQSITPAALGSIIMLTLVMMVAFVAHLYRDYIPAAPHHPRHRHNHGAIKMGLMFVFIIGILVLYGGGQI